MDSAMLRQTILVIVVTDTEIIKNGMQPYKAVDRHVNNDII